MPVGVYAIVNEEMGHIIYIGCSKILEERWRIHLRELRRRISRHTTMQEIYSRLGNKGLSFEILEETSKEAMFMLERKWTNLYQPIDNVQNTERQLAVNARISEKLTGIIHSPESVEKTHQKLRGQKLSQQARENMSKAHKGKPWSDKRRAAARKTLTEEHKEKIRQAFADKRKTL